MLTLCMASPKCSNPACSTFNNCAEQPAHTDAMKMGGVVMGNQQVSSLSLALPFPGYWLFSSLLNMILSSGPESKTTKKADSSSNGEGFDDDYISALKQLKGKIGVQRWRKLPVRALPNIANFR